MVTTDEILYQIFNINDSDGYPTQCSCPYGDSRTNIHGTIYLV